MKAIIMAGGEGTRLRPLTCTLPKPMARLSGKPIMEYILSLLSANGFDEAAVTLGYLPDAIERNFEDGFGSMRLTFIREDEPLGTAGSVKNAAKGATEPFLVISGDAMCDFNLSEIMQRHRQSGAAVTIVGAQVNDPREYGVIKTDSQGRVLGFIEKPAWSQAVSGVVNTGIYIINPECLDLIPDGRKFDFSQELFPEMMRRGMPISCFCADGYWCDIGNIEAYMQCQKDIFDGRVRVNMPANAQGIFSGAALPPGDYSIVPPVYIGKGAEIDSGAVIGPYAVIDAGAYIGANSRIRYSTVLENCCVSSGVSLTGALLCSGASLKTGAAMFEGSVAGSGAVIGEHARVNPNCLVWPGKLVGNGATVNMNLKYGSIKAACISDNALSENSGAQLSPETCVRLGEAVGSTRPGMKAGLGFDGSDAARPLYLAVMAGLMSSGSNVWDFADCFEAQLNFFVSYCGLGAGIFVSAGDGRAVKICGEGGLSIPRYFERDVEARMARSEFRRAPDTEIHPCAQMSAVRMLYRQELIRQAPYGLSGICAEVLSENNAINELMKSVLTGLGLDENSSTRFVLAPSGLSAEASAQGERVDGDALLAICCLNELRSGSDIAVPYEAPLFIDALAAEYGRRVFRYLSSPADNSDSAARRLSARQLFVRDGLFMTVKLLSVMKERERSLDELAAELPEYHRLRKTIPTGLTPARIAQIIGEENVSIRNDREGIRLVRENGKLLILPSGTGDSVRIFAEAKSMEAASELCLDFEELIRSAQQRDE